jgi:spermidine/putrescine transport system permease protein
MNLHSNTRRRIAIGSGGAVINLVLLLQFAPVALIVLFSFNATPRLSFPFEGFSPRWYSEIVAQPQFVAAFKNSLLCAFITALVSSMVGALAAFAIQAYSVRKRSAVEGIFTIPNVTPALLLGVGLALLTHTLGISRGIFTIVAGHVIVALPFVILAMRSRVAEFDFSLIEAARDLGASPSRAFLDVVFPLVRTAVVSSAFLAAALSMDEFIITQFIRGSENTVPTIIFGQLRRGVDPSVNAMASIILLTTLTLAGFAQLFARRES